MNVSQNESLQYQHVDGAPINCTSQTPFDTMLQSDTVVPVELSDFLAEYLGNRYHSNVESVALTVVYCIVLVTGVVGNVATCVVVASNKYLHTPTNYYLVSLAVSDALAVVFGVPQELYSVWEAYPWRFGEFYCLFKTFLVELVTSASVLTITAFTVERYFAVCHPLTSRPISFSRASRVIIIVWIAAACTALPYPLNTTTYHYVFDPVTNLPLADSLVCNIPLDRMPTMKYVLQVSTILLFILPMFALTGLCVSMSLAIRNSQSIVRSNQLSRNSRLEHSNDDLATAHRGIRSRSAVQRILVTVLVTFFVCWAPFHAQRIMTASVPDDCWTSTLIEVQTVLFYISGILYYVSSTVNLILYNIVSPRYRRAFVNTLCRRHTSRSQHVVVMQTTSRKFGDAGCHVPIEDTRS